MDINIGNGIGSVPIGPLGGEMTQPSGVSGDAKRPKPLTITDMPPGIPEGEPSVDDIPDTALSRQDALGQLVAGAFNLPPPAMPNFS